MWSKFFGRHTDDSAKHNRRATRRLQLQGEPLEERRLLAIDVLGVPDWVDQGPRPILNGSATIPPNNPVTGAAQSIAVNPANSAQIYLGMVNGGIWRTNNANTANPSAMTWELLTPQAPSLAVGSIAFSPLDATGNTLYAGTGTFSNLNNAGGAAVGILRSTDGGATWVNFGVNPADEPRIKTVLPTSIDLDPGAGVSQMVLVAGIDGSGGLYRSSNNGQSFTILSGSNGLPSGAVTQLIVDPNNAQRFFAAVPGIGGGVFRGDFNSVTGIISWTAVNTGIPTADIGTSANIQLTAEAFGATTVLFAGLADPPATGTIDAELTGVFRSVNGGGNWTALGTPASFNPWRAAGSGFSMVADPTDEDVVYIGGLQSPSEIFRYNPVGATWDLITGAGAQGGTAPHADTRDMVFLSDTVLLESDDGGLYFLPNPLDSTNNAWGSFIGETALGTALGGVEMHDIAWDSISNVIIGGSQDNGTEAQLTPNNLVWSRFQGGDGGDVAVDSLTLAGANRSIRYSSQQRLGSFRRQVVDSLNVAVGASVELLPAGGLAGFVGQFITPIALNAIAPPAGQSTRLVIGGGTDDVVTVGAVYEANNAGVAADAASVNWTQVPTGAGFASVSALVYGGRKGGASNPDVLYAGSDGKVFLRTTSGGMLNPTAGSFGAVRDIALDPNDWAHAFVVSDDEVWETIDAGANWANRTGNLGNGNLRTVEFVELGAVDVLLVGGAGGVFRSLSNNPGVWTELGAGMPNAVTYDLDYDSSDDVLVAGTFGTGVWTVPAASTKIAQPGVMDIVGDTDFPGQDDVIRIVRNADNPSLLDVTLNGDLYLPRPQLSTLNQINVRGLSGNDTLIIDSSNGLVEVPGGIRFDGGTGFDLIRLEQTGGGQQDSDEYSVGALNNSGTSVITGPSGVQKLFFENVEPLVDLVPAVNLTVNGTPEANAINYGVGPVATNGLVTVDNHESIEFSNKDTLTINAGSGNDVVNLNNANVPTELTLIAVHGDDGDDEITTRSTAGVVLFAAGDAGNDTIDASGTASVVTLEGNDGDDVLQGGSAADTLTGGEGDDTFIASAGADTLTGGAGVNTLLVRGTAGDDEIELYQSAPGVIEVAAPVGSGSYSITDLALVQVQGLEGNDTIRVRGNASVDSANGVAMAIDAMSGNDTLIVDSSNGLVDVPGGIRFDGGTGFDLIRLEQSEGDQQDSHEYSVGAVNGSGTSVITGPSGVQQLFFENVEPLVDLVPAVNLTVNGTPEANAINYGVGPVATNGLVTVDNYESIEFSNKDTLTINADSGNDVVNLNNLNVPAALTSISVFGDDGDDEITTRSTAGVVLFAAGGAGNDTIDASGTASVVTLEGNDGDDVLQGGSAADTLTGGAGDDTLIASAGDDTLTGGAGVDTLLVRGTVVSDTLSLFQSAAGTLDVTLSGSARSYTIDELDLIRVETLAGDDAIQVRASDTLVGADSLPMDIDGGGSNGRDLLVVNDEGLGNLVLYRKGADDTSGSVIVGELAPVSFQQIENVKFTPLNSITGGTGTDGQGRLVVFKHDPFENNDTMANATHLGGGATINVDPTIDPGGGPFDVPGDEDWYRFDAAENGVLDFQVFFTTLDVLPNGRPGLPQGGLLNVEIYDAQGNLIGSGQNFLNGGGTVIGKRIDVPVVRNQTYYMRILGAPAEEGPSEAINVYNFTVINTTLPVPFQVDLQAASDSGRHNDDDVTRIATSTFDAYLDDDRLLEFTNLGLVPDTIDNGVADGDFGVQFFNNGVLIGFATYQGPLPAPPPSPTVANNRWQFTIVGGGVGMQEGDNNFITAAVWVRDRANPTQFSRGDFSTPLQVTLDTIAPAQPTIVLDPSTTDSGVTGQQNTFADRITRFTAPGFTGSAEANAIVRLWADGPPISVGINASDVFEGLTVAVPLDGNLAFPNGQWQMTPRFDLNDPSVGFPLDGRRLMSATAEDLAGNESSRDNPVTLDIFIDTAGPQLYTPPGASSAVHITDDPAFNLFDPKPAAGPTPRVDSITINIRDLPFRDALNFPIDPALVESVAATAGNYLLRGDHNGVIAIESVDVVLDPIVTGQPATGRIILNFAEPLPDDRFTLTVSDNLVDPAGNHLDGESNAQQPVGIPSAISGDGQPGGAFVGRFTVDSRPEIGVYSDGSVYVDTNGNLVYDTTNSDFTNRDLVFKLGLATQIVFAGKFHPPGQAANGFDRLAVYGLVNGQWQFTFAGDDGTAKFTTSSLAVNGLPLAGNFDGNAANGDEVGVFDGKRWYLDTNGNNTIDNGDASFAGDMRGYPIAGDFDGDGLDDLATWTSGKYYFDLAANGGLDGDAEYSLDFGFSGVLERPVAGDLNLDGIDDLGLWTPGRSGQSNGSKAEWYFLLSEAPRDEERGVAGTIEAFDHPFSPQPVGNDLFATFGESFALPVFGNYDPPLTSAPPTGGNGGGGSTTNPPTSGPTVSLDSVQVTTGLNGAPQIKLNVKLSQAATTAVTVDYFTSDFNAQGGSITIPAGATTQSITIGGSSDLSSGKSVFATLDNARQAAIGTAQAVSQGVAAGVDAALDVNGDGKISSLDALVVINAINRAPANGGTPTSLSVSATKLDVNGDGRVSAIDALRVINHLNRESGTQTAAAAAAPIAAAGLPQPETVAAASPASDAAAPAASFSAEQLATLAWHSAVSNLFESPSDLIEDLARAKQKR